MIMYWRAVKGLKTMTGSKYKRMVVLKKVDECDHFEKAITGEVSKGIQLGLYKGACFDTGFFSSV